MLATLALAPALGQAQSVQLTLQDAVRLAQKQGLQARAAGEAAEAARWRERGYRARLLPQLSMQGTAPDVRRAITPVIQPDGTTKFVEQSQMQSSLSVGVSQPILLTGGTVFVSSGLSRLDLFGPADAQLWQSTPLLIGIQQSIFRPNALAWDRRDQAMQSDIAERVFTEATEEASEAAASAFFDLYAAEAQVRNTAANVAVNDSLYLLSKGRFEVGKIGENDLLQSELALLRARNALDAARLDRDRAAASLRRVLGLPADAQLTLVPPLDVQPFDPDPELAVQQATRNRSEISSAELDALRADRKVREARLDSWLGATVTATAGLNQTSGQFGEAYHSPLNSQRLSVGVQMPLAQWGAGHAEVEAARAERERVTSQTRARREALEQEARFAALQLPQARRQLEIAAKADTVAGRRFDVAKNRYVIGRIGIDNLYLAQSEKDQAALAYVQALRGYWTAYYRLRRLTLYDFEAGQGVRAR